jgi:O-antigen ligase
MTALSTAARFDRAFFANLADYLVVGVAMALPWSTTATGILIAAWLVVVLPTLDAAAVKRELFTPAGGLPVLLCCLGAVGMVWADVDWAARLEGLDGFIRLLVIPLLLMQFRRSVYGRWVICGFLLSSALLLLTSYLLVLTPGLTWRGHVNGVPVHDDIFQASNFLACGFGAFGYAILECKKLDRRIACSLFIIGALFLANFAFVIISRAAVAVVLILAALLGWRVNRWKGIFSAVILAVAIGTVALIFSASLRGRMDQSIEEFQAYHATNAVTPIGDHIAFLKESAAIVASAPVIGHGTGSIPEEFRRITAGKTGASAEATVNPHDQTFAVAIQIGIVGALVLWAMWIAHLLLFREEGITAWLGMVVVVENIVSSLFHTHLFDFNNGWLYVFGVGVLGGIVLCQRDTVTANSVAPS